MSEERSSADVAAQILPENTILFGKYKVLAPINLQGGTAFLYRAVNIRTDQIVALKEFFPKGYCQRGENLRISPPKEAEKRKTYEDARKMFEREAALLKENQDEGVILKYYDMFHANGTIYYAMEYLEGESLKEYLKKKEKMELPEALALLEPVFDALVILHQKKVLHRDISPDNIFLCKNGSVRLIDFGNARVQEKGKSRVLDWAKMGYAPVEMQSDNFRQDTWSDVYSLAATVYRCITGTEPPNAVQRTIRESIKKPADAGCVIEPAQEQAILKGLAVYPEGRYQTIAEFKAALYQEEQTTYQGWLLGLDGVFIGKEMPVRRTLMLGRKPDCDLTFPQGTPGVSGHHCEIRWDGNHMIVKDAGSTYGTRYLNGQKMEQEKEIFLKEGEGFIIGDNQIFAVVKKPEKTGA